MLLPAKHRLNYIAPQASEEFAFTYGKNSVTNEARTRSAIQMQAKKVPVEDKSKGKADQGKASPA